MTARPKNRAVVYLRRSDAKQENSLDMQLQWATTRAQQEGVALDATPGDLAEMRAQRRHQCRSIFLDDAISGAVVDPPGIDALIKTIIADKTISHLFVHRRDRLGRPEDLTDMMKKEAQVTNCGVTIVFSDSIAEPTRRGQPNTKHIVEMVFGYQQSGDYLRQLADRVVSVQRHLASQGFRTGGSPPYGFGRFLVNPDGEVVEQLAEHRHVRHQGHHVQIRPMDFEKLKVWIMILDLKRDGWGTKRIAIMLNDLGVPSPNAGQTRTDRGVRHTVSGKWSPNTVSNLCRNAAIIGLQNYGRRSMGDHRRLGVDGPRLLDDDDRTASGAPRVIFNQEEVRVSSSLPIVPEYDPDKWHEIQRQMDDRGKNQRGIRRAKDPSKYPLSCIVFDLTDGCGAPMYGVTSGQRRLYRCGRYMRTSGSECNQNSVDGEALLKYVLNLLSRRIVGHGGRTRLQQMLAERAERVLGTSGNSSAKAVALAAADVTRLEHQLNVAARRMAIEQDDVRYEALSQQHKQLHDELAAARARHDAAQDNSLATAERSVEGEVEAALNLISNLGRVASDDTARADIGPLFQSLGIRVGLSFAPTVLGSKRMVQTLIGGLVAFGNAALPVPIFGHNNCATKQIGEGQEDEHAACCRNRTGDNLPAIGDGQVFLPAADHSGPLEGNSLTKVNRGDRI